MKLFDDFERTDSRPAHHQESSFAFLNRISTPWWMRVRDLVESWFADYCVAADASKAMDVRSRFRSKDYRQHTGAWWELYVFALLRALGPERRIIVEPPRDGASTRPDFGIGDDKDEHVALWIEAVTTFSAVTDRDTRRASRAFVLDTINEVRSPDFWIAIRFQTDGAEQPTKREITEPLKRWLHGLNREDVIADLAACRRHETTISARGWDIKLSAMPKKTPRLDPHDRLIGMGPAVAGFVNDAAVAREAILRKGRHYDGLEAPLVVAVSPSSPVLSDREILEALFGSELVRFHPDRPDDAEHARSPDGAWSHDRQDVAGVIFGVGIFPWTVAKHWPRLWLNPHLSAKVELLGSMPRMEVGQDGSLVFSDANESPAELFGLEPDWPGQEDPFTL